MASPARDVPVEPRLPVMSIDLDALPRQLRYWTGHCLLNALPSGVIACIFLKYWKNPEALLAMGSAVIAFILLFAFLTSIRGPLTQPDHTLNRAIRAGVKFRKAVSLISLPLLIPPFTFLVPDLWGGLLAAWLTLQAAQLIDNRTPMAASLDRLVEEPTFTSVFATTMFVGLFISFFMLMFSFFAVLVIQRRERAKLYPLGHAN
jgi:hypothetical protein